MKSSKGVPSVEEAAVLADDLRVMFDSATRRRLQAPGITGLIPAVDVFKREGSILVRIEVPGVRPDDLDVIATPRLLTIEGRKRREGDLRPDQCQRMERKYSGFTRSVPLPAGSLVDQAIAVIHDGVLEIEVPVISRLNHLPAIGSLQQL